MDRRHGRRQFLSVLGRGLVVAGVGGPVAEELGLTPSCPSIWAEDGGDRRLSFGPLESLAAVLAETPPEQLLARVVPLLRAGTSLRDLVGAAALANARACGGEDYVGFHTFMALAPALQMAGELPSERRALPVLKVLHRNARCLHDPARAGTVETLVPVPPVADGSGSATAEQLREAVRARDLPRGEQVFAQLSQRGAEQAWNALLPTVHDGTDVHRIVLAHRAWDMLSLVGPGHAGTLLRQSLHYCWKHEEHSARRFSALRELLPKLFDQHRLDGPPQGPAIADDAWIDTACQSLMTLKPADSAGQVAEWLAAGIDRTAICDALALAANQLVLRDEGRPREWTQPHKPVGSVHGDSIGVHACDSANAWRHVALSANHRNAAASLILAGWHLAMDYHESGRSLQNWEPRPVELVLRGVTLTDPQELLRELDGVIREKDQERACAVVQRYCDLGHPHRGVLDLLLRYAISEDGALHAEKYYRTTTDELARARPQHKTRQLVALARVTASEYGTPAPGYDEACGLLDLPQKG